MASEQDNVRAIAERVARQLGERPIGVSRSSSPGGERVTEEISAVRAGLLDLQKKLASIESKLSAGGGLRQPQAMGSVQGDRSRVNVPATHSPWLGSMYVQPSHPSQERFGVEEAAVSELVDFFEGEKTCEMEPGEKPCDHCAMCSSRGF